MAVPTAPTAPPALPPPAPPLPGGALAGGLLTILDSLADFLEDEARDAEAPAGATRGLRRAAPGWDWALCRLLPLLQQYSGGLSDAVIRTSLWHAWRQGVDAAAGACSDRWTPLATLARAADDPGPPPAAAVSARVVAARPPPPGGLPASLDLDDGSTPRPLEAMVHSRLARWVAPGGPLAPGAALRLAAARPWRPEVLGDPAPPRLLPSEAVAVVVGDVAAGVAALGGGRRGAAAPSAMAADSCSGGAATGDAGAVVPGAPLSAAAEGGTLVAGVVAAVGPTQSDWAGAACQRTGLARVVWLSDLATPGKAAAPAGAAPGAAGPPDATPASTPPPPTPLLLLDGAAALGDVLAPGETLVLRAVAAPQTSGAPPALEVAGACLATVVPRPGSRDVASAGALENGGGKENAAPAEELAAGGGGMPIPAGKAVSVTSPPAKGNAVAAASPALMLQATPRPPPPRRRTPLAALTPVDGVTRLALVGAVAAARLGADRVLRLTLADAGGAVDVCLPPEHAARGALGLDVGDCALVTCAAARVVETGGGGGGGGEGGACGCGGSGSGGGGNTSGGASSPRARVECWPSAPANVQGLASLPALLTSPPLYVPVTVRLGDGPLPALPAVVEATVAAVTVVRVRRTHASCGRPLARAVLDLGDDGFGGPCGGSGGGRGSSGGGGGSGCGGGGGGESSGAGTATADDGTLLSSDGVLCSAADGGVTADGGLWTCAFCGADVGAGATAAGLEATIELAGEDARLRVAVRGDAACALLGTVSFEYLAWPAEQRVRAAERVTGRRVRAALLDLPNGFSGLGGEVAVAAGLLVLDEGGDDGGGECGEHDGGEAGKKAAMDEG